MEARLIDVEKTVSGVLSECSKMLIHMKRIKDTADGIFNYMKTLNHSSFLQEYSSMHKFLNQLYSELIGYNCQFELFFLKMKESAPKSYFGNDFLFNTTEDESVASPTSTSAAAASLPLDNKIEESNNYNNFIEIMKKATLSSSDNSNVEKFYKNLLKETRQNALKDYTDCNEIVDLEAFVKYPSVPVEEECCFISHVESPSLIYIQLISEDSALIDCIPDQILQELPLLRSFSTKVEAQKYLTKYCVCYLQRNASWYRGLIENWLMSEKDFVVIRLLDYGYLCRVHINNIREANPRIFTSKIMAVKSKLAWLIPPYGLKDWPIETNAFLKKLLLGEQESIFFLSHVQWTPNYLLIDLKSKDTGSIAAELISNHLAIDSPSLEEIVEEKLGKGCRN